MKKITQTTEHLSLQYQRPLFAKVYIHTQYTCSVLEPKLLKALMGSSKGHGDGDDCGVSTSVDENTSRPDEVTASKDRRYGPPETKLLLAAEP